MKTPLPFVVGCILAFLITLGNTWVVPPAAAQELVSHHPEWDVMDSAFNEGKDTRDFTRLRAALARLFTDNSQDVKSLGLGWIGAHEQDLTIDEFEELDKDFIRLNPINPMSAGVQRSIAERRLSLLSREDRMRRYMEAVQSGKATVWGGLELSRGVALGRAAVDGIEEFESLIKQNSAEIDRMYPREGFSQTDYLLWDLRLRSGAANRSEAIEFQARRLAEMSDDKFEGLMNHDAAFNQATKDVILEACKVPASPGCRSVSEVTLRQLDYHRALKKSVEAGNASPETVVEPKWLDWIRGGTEKGFVKLLREREAAAAARSQDHK